MTCNKKPFILCGILLLVCIVGISCSRSYSTEPGPKRLVVGLESAPSNLDPRFATDAYSSRLVGIIYSSLVKLDESAAYRGDLAKTWEQPEPARYIFHLRDNARFHNGDPLTAEDVCFTFNLIMDPDSKSPYRADFKIIQSVECPDESTVDILLKEPNAPFLTSMTVGIIGRNANLEELPRRPVGSGPFMVADLKAGDYILLKRFDDYYGQAPWLEEVAFRIIPNGVTRVLEIERGGVDLLQNSTPPEAFERLSSNKKIKIERQRGINYNYLGFNLEDPVLKDRWVRAAIAHAIDRDAIIRHLWKGAAEPASGLLSPRNWAYNPDVQTYSFDPGLARKLLDKAGYADPDGDGPNPRFSLSFKTSTDRLRRRIAEVIRTQLADVGIEVEVRSYEFGTFYRDIKSGNFQMYTLAWVGVTDPDIYRFIFHSDSVPPDGANRNRYSNPEIDRLTEMGRRETDIERRKKIYGRVQEILALDLPYVSLYHTDDVACMRGRVEGFRIRPGGDFLSLPEVRLKH